MKPKKTETETNGRKNDKYKPDLHFTFWFVYKNSKLSSHMQKKKASLSKYSC